MADMIQRVGNVRSSRTGEGTSHIEGPSVPLEVFEMLIEASKRAFYQDSDGKTSLYFMTPKGVVKARFSESCGNVSEETLQQSKDEYEIIQSVSDDTDRMYYYIIPKRNKDQDSTISTKVANDDLPF